MERASKEHFGRASLRDEHIHRYQIAARVARGFVVDCACGIGYASELIAKQTEVEAYLGIDPSIDAIEFAIANYSGERIRFECGMLENNSCRQSSIDTFLMFETLEHTTDPNEALENIRNCLKEDGLLIGSVPSAEYEALCESTYGPNPFHLQRFTKEQLTEILGKYFGSVRIFSMEFVLGSLFQRISDNLADLAEIVPIQLFAETVCVAGSIIFIAGSEKRVEEAVREIGDYSIFLSSMPKVILDREEVEPIRTAMQSMEALIRERDEAISEQARMLEERWSAMQSMEALIRERDEAISEQQELLEKRPTVTEAMRVLLSAVRASFQHRVGRFLGKK
jgi:SAM-dependent methyltransferase